MFFSLSAEEIGFFSIALTVLCAWDRTPWFIRLSTLALTLIMINLGLTAGYPMIALLHTCLLPLNALHVGKAFLNLWVDKTSARREEDAWSACGEALQQRVVPHWRRRCRG